MSQIAHQIIITRPQPYNLALQQKIQQASLHSIQMPAIGIQNIPLTKWPNPNQIDRVIILSQFAITSAEPNLKLYQNSKFYCVGPGTQKGLLDIGIQSTIPTTNYSTQGLLALNDMMAVQNKHILILTGSPMQQAFKTELCQRGAKVKQLATYRRIPLTDDIINQLGHLDPNIPTCFVTTSFACLDALQAALKQLTSDWQNSQVIVVGKKSQILAEKSFHKMIIADNADHNTLLRAIRAWYSSLKDSHANQMPDAKPKAKKSKHVICLWLVVLLLSSTGGLITVWGYHILMKQSQQLQHQQQTIETLTDTLQSVNKQHLIKWPEVQYAILQAKTSYLNNHQTQLSLQWLATAQSMAQTVSPIHLKPLIKQIDQLKQQLMQNPTQTHDIQQIIKILHQQLAKQPNQHQSTPTDTIQSWHDLDAWITTHWWNLKQNEEPISPINQLRIQQLIGLLRDSEAMLAVGNTTLWQKQIQSASQLADLIHAPQLHQIINQLDELPKQMQKDTDHFDQLLTLNHQLQSEHTL